MNDPFRVNLAKAECEGMGVRNRTFDVYGHFYSVEWPNGDRLRCRSVLELCSEGLGAGGRSLLDLRPDAVCIMMNPGSSMPLAEPGEAQAPALVPARPDRTQHQIMRLMEALGWNHVRVLNLSDIREPRSRLFHERFRVLESALGYQDHSIFSENRRSELARRLLRKPGAPIICAWGVSPRLDPLIDRCTGRIHDQAGQVGLLKPGSERKFYHPLPTLQRDKDLWVANMLRLLMAATD